MIQEALKLVAEFKDNASEGLKKLRGNLTELGAKSDALKPLETSRAAKAIGDADRAAKQASSSSGGIGSLANIISRLRDGFSDLASGAGDVASAVGVSVAGAATGASAAVTSLGAGIAGVGAAISATANRVNLASGDVKKAVEIFQTASAAATGDDTPQNAGRRGVYAFLTRELGLASQEARRLRGDIEKLSFTLQETANPARALASIFRVGLYGGSGTDKAIRFASIRALVPVLGALVAAGAAFAGVAGAIGVSLNSAARQADQLAQKLGITVERLKTLQLIANETGTSVEELTRVYDKLSKDVLGKEIVGGEQLQALNALGLAIEDIKNLSADQAALKILERFEDLGQSAAATGAAQVLLGESFRASSLGIKAASSSFNDYADRVAKYGAGESKLLTQQGQEQEVAFNNLGLAFSGLGQQIAENIGPAITRLAQTLADLVSITRGSGVAASITSAIFSVLNLVLNDFSRLLGGAMAAFIAFLTGEFRQAWEITKLAVADATDAVKNFGDRSKDTAAVSVQAAETAAAAAEKEADAKKLAAQAEVERLKRLAASKKAAEEQLKLFGDAKQALLQQLGLLGKETEAERLLWETQEGRYKSLAPAQKQELADLARRVDLKNKELALEEKKKQLQDGLSTQDRDLALSEEELRFTGLTSDERDRQVFLLRELNRLQREGVGLGDVELQGLTAQVKVMADRRKALAEAARDAETINNLIDSSYGETEKRVRRSIELASKLLEDRRISEVDYVRFVKEQIGQLTAFNAEAAAEANEFWREAARGIQQSLSTFFFDFMQGKLTDLASSFKRVIDQMVANALAARLAQALFGSGFENGGQLGGFVGQAAGFLGSAFGGARAMGGPVQGGKAYMVGEKGPELAVFGQSGTVVPNSALQNMGNNVTFQITAMDSQDVLRAMSKIQREGAKLFGSASNRYNLQGA